MNDDARGSASQHDPRVAAAPDGSAHAVWVDGRDREVNIYSATLTPGSTSWSVNTKASQNGTSRKWTPDIAWRGNIANEIDGYAVWEDDRSGDYDIYFNQFDCDWPPPDAPGCRWDATDLPISDDTTGAAQYWARIVVADGEPVAFWLDDRGGATHVRARRVDQGGASEVISDAAAEPVSLAASATADGHMFVVWQDARGTSYDIWGTEYDPATGSWSTPIRIDDDPASSAQLRPTVAVSATEVAAAWRDSRTGNPDIRARLRATQGPGVDQFTYAYDGLNRLTTVSGPVAESFTFDAATNVATRTGPAATYSHDQANRVTSDGSRTFTWDGADRLVQRGPDTFAYDALSRLTSATVAGATTSYTYDGDGLLATRTDASGPTTFVWDSSVAPAPLLEADTDRVIHGLGPLYLARADGSTTRLVRDALGSVRGELNDLGVVTKAFRYAAYGAITDRTPLDAAPTLLGFTGELADPSGLTYLRARWYDPRTGRFLSRDPFNGTVEHPASQNLYAYGHANPARFTDPTGNCPFCLIMAVGGVAGATVNASVYLLASKQSGDFTWGGLAGAAATGAVIGAIAPVAGPAGGSFGGALATATLNALAGAGGYTVGLYAANAVDSVTGPPGTRTFSAEAALLHAAGSVFGGALGDKVSPMVGVHTLRQLRLFAPRTWAGFMRSGPNMQALEGSALVGALYSSGIGLLAHQGNQK